MCQVRLICSFCLLSMNPMISYCVTLTLLFYDKFIFILSSVGRIISLFMISYSITLIVLYDKFLFVLSSIRWASSPMISLFFSWRASVGHSFCYWWIYLSMISYSVMRIVLYDKFILIMSSVNRSYVSLLTKQLVYDHPFRLIENFVLW